MKICILTPRFPYPQYGGDTLRINEIAKYLKSKGHELILVSMSDEETPAIDDASRLYDKVFFVQRKRKQSMFYSLLYFLRRKPMQCGYYFSRKYIRLLKEVVEQEKPDLYISHLLRMTPYLERLGLQEKSIVEMTDALSKTYILSRSAKGVGLLKYVYSLEQRLIKEYELHVIHCFKKVVLVSHADREYLKKNVLNTEDIKHLCVLTNGVDYAPVLSETYDDRKICFVGNMRSLQNQDAAIFFAREVFPLIKERYPDVTFHIVGSLPSPNILALASESIVVTGFVDDINSYIAGFCLSVAPVRVAAGIQNKVLTAMGCGLPVIMSSLISNGIQNLRDRENCYICDDPVKIAEICCSLMNDRELRNAIGQKGYSLVKDIYSWQRCLEDYELLPHVVFPISG